MIRKDFLEGWTLERNERPTLSGAVNHDRRLFIVVDSEGLCRGSIQLNDEEAAAFFGPGALTRGNMDGYVEAFFAVGRMMDLPAQSTSPKEVWETKMLPRLEEMFAKEKHPYRIGDKTMRAVFEKNGMKNMSDLQAVMDAVERALPNIEPEDSVDGN